MLSLNKKNFWLHFSPIIISLIMTVLIVLLAKSLPPKLPLFYSLPWGERQLASIQQLFILPASIALVALFNLIVSWQLHPKQTSFKNILFFSSQLVGLILTITFLKIVLLFI